MVSKEVRELVFKKDRFHVKIDGDGIGSKSLPRYIFNWLKHNPAFKEIPKGYVIHHLDHDKTNDDPTNLVLMQKYHHMAYHMKQKINEPKITFSIDDIEVDPIKPNVKPRCYYHPPAKRFYVLCFVNDESGRSKRIKLWRNDGQPLWTQKDAEELIEKTWKDGL